MKKLVIIGLIILCTDTSYCQNLVPNPSFEDYSDCPNAEDQISFVDLWEKFSYQQSTPDYFNACANPYQYGVPESVFGFQYPQEGVAYIGLVAITGTLSDYREHVGVELSEPLVVGEQYYLTLYISLADVWGLSAPCNNFGARLSTQAYSPQSPAPVNNTAHVFAESIVSDTLGWHLLSGSFIADSAYSYLSVGNFFDDVATDTLAFSDESSLSFYYVDNICLSQDSLDCFPLIVVEPDNQENFIVFPNPASTSIEVSSQHTFRAVHIYDSMGRLAVQESFPPNFKSVIDVSDLLPGCYFIHVDTSKGLLVRRLLVK